MSDKTRMTGENANKLRAAYYTERGVEALEQRLKDLVVLYSKEQQYPAPSGRTRRSNTTTGLGGMSYE